MRSASSCIACDARSASLSRSASEATVASDERSRRRPTSSSASSIALASAGRPSASWFSSSRMRRRASVRSRRRSATSSSTWLSARATSWTSSEDSWSRSTSSRSESNASSESSSSSIGGSEGCASGGGAGWGTSRLASAKTPTPRRIGNQRSFGARSGNAFFGARSLACASASAIAASMKGVFSALLASSRAFARRDRSPWARSRSCAGRSRGTGRSAPTSTPSTGKLPATHSDTVSGSEPRTPSLASVSATAATPAPAVRKIVPASRARCSRTRRRVAFMARARPGGGVGLWLIRWGSLCPDIRRGQLADDRDCRGFEREESYSTYGDEGSGPGLFRGLRDGCVECSDRAETLSDARSFLRCAEASTAYDAERAFSLVGTEFLGDFAASGTLPAGFEGTTRLAPGFFHPRAILWAATGFQVSRARSKGSPGRGPSGSTSTLAPTSSPVELAGMTTSAFDCPMAITAPDP